MMFVFLLCAIRCVVWAHPGVTRAAAVKPAVFIKSRRFNLIPPLLKQAKQTDFIKSVEIIKRIKDSHAVNDWVRLGSFVFDTPDIGPKLGLNWV